MERKLRKKLQERQCVICGEMFQPRYYNCVCCSHKCSSIHTERKKFGWLQNIKQQKEESLKAIPEKVILITDEEQKKIDNEVANRLAVKLETKIYERGSEEFNILAEELLKQHKKY